MLAKQASEFLGVTRATLKKWEKKGKIKVARNSMNNYRMYKKEDLIVLLEELENQTKEEKGNK